MVQNSQGYRVNEERRLQEESVQGAEFRAPAADSVMQDTSNDHKFHSEYTFHTLIDMERYIFMYPKGVPQDSFQCGCQLLL